MISNSYEAVKQNERDLVLKILADYSKCPEVFPDQSLAELGVENKKELLSFIYQQNPSPFLLLEACLGLDEDLPKSNSFIGKPKQINKVADILANTMGIMYLHQV